MGNDPVRELAAMPPGPTLAALLEGVDPCTLTAEQAVPVLRAWSRQRAHDHARMAATMNRVAALSRHAAGPTLGEWAGVEIAAALTWSDGKASRELGFSEALAGLPLVATAFDDGRIDHGKAWVFTDVLGSAELTAAQIDALCATYVPVASGLTAGQPRHRLVRAVLAIDPDAAARRYRRAVRARGVVGYRAADGTAVITASGLPADQAAAACARVDALADRLRHAGCPGTIIQIRTDVFLRLLDGRLTGLTAEGIISTLLADAAAAAAADTESAGTAGSADIADEAAADAAADATADAAAADGAADPAAAGAPGDTTAGGTGVVDAASELADLPGTPVAGGRGVGRGGRPGAEDGREGGGAPAEVEIRVGLATLLGLDRRPGEIPGWGPVLPGTAHDLVARHHRAPWRFAVVDDDGHLLLAGRTRHRPTHHEPGPPPAEGGLVELHVTATLLRGLDAAAHPRWAAVISDLARQYADRDRLLAALDAHPGRRHARGPLLRHLQVRDRTCTAPGCRRPARTCHADHTRDHAHGGPTTRANTGPLCPRHHALKHHGGWRLHQPRAGRFHWTSPLGEHYATRGEPAMPPLSDPLSDPRPGAPEPPTNGPPTIRPAAHPTFEQRPQPQPAPGAAPPPRRGSPWTRSAPEDPDDPAPF